MNARVLVADDSVTIRKFVALAFENEAIDVLSASDGSEAMQLVETSRPDVLLADVFMPGLGGYELCDRIKSSPLLNATVVILLVGMFEPFDEEEAHRVGADGHMSKPLDPAELLGTVRSFLNVGRYQVSTAHAGTQRPLEVSERALESFTGPDRVLDILSPGAAGTGSPHSLPRQAPAICQENRPEDHISSRVESEVRRLAPSIVREIAERLLPVLLREAAR